MCGETQRGRIVATVFGGFTLVCALKKERREQIVIIGFGGLTVIIVLSEGGGKCG